MRLSSRTVGLQSAVVMVAIWSSFTVIARAAGRRIVSSLGGISPLPLGQTALLGTFGGLPFMVAARTRAAYSVLARRHAVDAVRVTIAVTAFACATYVPAFALLTGLGIAPMHPGTAPTGEIAFGLLFQGCGSAVACGGRP
ncbi:hypothetical protein PY257_05270 [Ramlibacter sp. H39-3-26]|uniref:hypothetical protein n=1 Tax=Curvibacter soli TaxID=3031331 RepID=UPI0023DA117B|nr:hypothetical protein [Ramlibacter sp. H39-3-26]MDF1484598.1 hypothetical protein [Ramlibacter sp. H39-3-26]